MTSSRLRSSTCWAITVLHTWACTVTSTTPHCLWSSFTSHLSSPSLPRMATLHAMLGIGMLTLRHTSSESNSHSSLLRPTH
jgi:hypothetical protein